MGRVQRRGNVVGESGGECDGSAAAATAASMVAHAAHPLSTILALASKGREKPWGEAPATGAASKQRAAWVAVSPRPMSCAVRMPARLATGCAKSGRQRRSRRASWAGSTPRPRRCSATCVSGWQGKKQAAKRSPTR